MSDNDPYISELIDTKTSIRFHCPNSSGYQSQYRPSRCGGTKTFGPREFIGLFGDRRLSQLAGLKCPTCGHRMHYDGIVHPQHFMESDERQFYEDRIFTDYLIKFVILAFATLTLFGLSSYLPRNLAFIVTSSVLISATLIVVFLTLFTFFSRFRLAVIVFERSVKEITLSFLILCLALAVAALFLVLLL